MRGYIFTRRERHAVLQFIVDNKRTMTVNKLVSGVDANWHVLQADFKLMLKLKRVVDAGY